MPRFSVIIPLYNKEAHIEKTLKSVLDQSFTDFEVIVVNDGSSDNGPKIVESIADNRIKLFTTENLGVSHARNLGTEKASAELLAFLDADDYWLDFHLEDLNKLALAFPDCGLYAKSYEKNYYNKKTVKPAFSNLKPGVKGVVNDYFSHCLIDSIAWTSAVAIPKNVFEKHQGFDLDLASGQDTDLWIKLALNEAVAFHDKISAIKVQDQSSKHLSSSSKRIDRLKIIDRYKAFEPENHSLKKYLDKIRFAIAIERKMAKDFNTYKKLESEITFSNLSMKQKLVLKLPGFILRKLKSIQILLLKNKLYLSPFR